MLYGGLGSKAAPVFTYFLSYFGIENKFEQELFIWHGYRGRDGASHCCLSGMLHWDASHEIFGSSTCWQTLGCIELE